ncbi:MAG: cyclic nucleotide-binding domain-containing protein [Candidatus Bipolaricaulota bacterium]|nr:MAG: cyclic nucleotide-binding domain-containing protein [Candidatus Bipolaricaulota bacterium]
MGQEALLKKVDLFQGLDDGELVEIEQICKSRYHGGGEVLFSEGSRGEEIYIVKKGKVRIDLKLGRKEDDCATVHRIRSGLVFGELALVDQRARSASATCEGPCEILYLSCKQLVELFERNNRIGYVVLGNLARLMATRLRKTNLQLVASVCWE